MSTISPVEIAALNEDHIRTYLSVLFEPTDHVTFRPIETWTEGNKKRSRVLYRDVLSIPLDDWLKGLMVSRVRALKEEHANAFIGVCPRQSSVGTFELAWQIQTVRCLWADIDGCSVDEALRRIREVGLPEPTMVVSSGNGVHVYWMLTEPVLTGAPTTGVVVDWKEIRGQRRPIRYMVVEGEKIWLDDPTTGKSIPANHPKLTDVAQRVQDICHGIAAAIGGDHTHDLSRLLRLPGTLNRKNERNGAEPKPCVLLTVDSTRRYPFESFSRFADQSPAKKKRETIARTPLPVPRRLTPAKTDVLNQKLYACANATDRSSADFSLCCWAIEKGVSRDEVWAQCQGVGKFAERGESYFDATWGKAEEVARANIYETLQKKNGGSEANEAHISDSAGSVGTEGDSVLYDDGSAPRRPTIYVDSSQTPLSVTLEKITRQLLASGNCYVRADQLVVVHNGAIRTILSSQELAGLLSELVEFYFVENESGQYKPLPTCYASAWLNNHEQRRSLPEIRLFTRNPVYTHDWRLLPPGFDPASGIYYAGPAIEPRQDTVHIDALFRDFCFKSPGDRTNYLGMLLTTVLIPQFIGSKPAVLFNGNQPGLGKSILAQNIATIRDGHPAETATYNPNDEEFEKRLGAIVRRGVTTIIIDNAKGRARNPRIESACLERSITDPILSFRLLGHSHEIRAENSHIFCITANTPDVSRDLITRSTVINLYYEGDPEHRTFSIPDPEGYAVQHREALLGELIGMVERWKSAGMPRVSVSSRFNKKGWASTVGGILAVNHQPDFLANAAEAATQLDDTQREFTELIAVMAEDPRGLWSASELVDLCSRHGLMASDLGNGSPRSMATKLGALMGRFVNKRFPLDDERVAVFRRTETRKGNAYQVFVEDQVPNLEAFAEPLPNLENVAGSAL